MNKTTIQQAAKILQSKGLELEGMQPVLINGKYTARYKVGGQVLTAEKVFALLG